MISLQFAKPDITADATMWREELLSDSINTHHHFNLLIYAVVSALKYIRQSVSYSY